MRQIIITATLLLASIGGAWALTATEAFVSAPNVVFPLLDKNTRLDMMDYYNSGSTTASKNKLEGASRVTASGDESLKFVMTEASSYQITVLHRGKDEVIALIETVNTPAPDSHIAFYTSEWKPVEKPCLEVPELKEWLNDAGHNHVEDVEAVVPFILAQYDYNTETATLTMTLNVSRYLSEEVYSRVKNWLKPELRYKWNGKKFSLVK